MHQPDLDILAERTSLLEAAKVKSCLSDGPVAESWLINSREGALVLRRDKPLASSLGLDRENEYRILKAAFDADLGPEPLWTSPSEGLLVCRYLESGTPGSRQTKALSHTARLAKLLRAVNRIEVKASIFEPVAIAERYAALAGEADAKPLLAQVIRRAGRLAAPVANVLCHRDPHAGNIIDDGCLRLIDWEYSSLGDPLFDLAVIARFDEFTAAQSMALLDEYLGGHDPQQWEAFQLQCSFYQSMERIWLLAVQSQVRS